MITFGQLDINRAPHGDITVQVELVWSYEEGAPGSLTIPPGWYCDSVEGTFRGKPIRLTDDEETDAIERFRPEV